MSSLIKYKKTSSSNQNKLSSSDLTDILGISDSSIKNNLVYFSGGNMIIDNTSNSNITLEQHVGGTLKISKRPIKISLNKKSYTTNFFYSYNLSKKFEDTHFILSIFKSFNKNLKSELILVKQPSEPNFILFDKTAKIVDSGNFANGFNDFK